MHRQPPRASVPGAGASPAVASRGRRAGVFATVLMLAPLHAGCGTSEPPGEGFEIVGFVVEATGTGDDGPPIPGAVVRFTSDTGRSVDGTSEGNGRYRLFVVTDTPFGEISATAAGFVEARETVFFDTASRRVDLVLPRGGSEPEP